MAVTVIVRKEGPGGIERKTFKSETESGMLKIKRCCHFVCLRTIVDHYFFNMHWIHFLNDFLFLARSERLGKKTSKFGPEDSKAPDKNNIMDQYDTDVPMN